MYTTPAKIMTLKIYLKIRDSAAVAEFASFLEEEVKSGRNKWTEISAEQKLIQVRRYDQCTALSVKYQHSSDNLILRLRIWQLSKNSSNETTLL